MKYLSLSTFRTSFIIYIIAVLALPCCTPSNHTTTDSDIEFNIPDGFELEKLFSPSEKGLGSWISIAEGPNNRYYASDQYGGLYTFIMPEVGSSLDAWSFVGIQ